MASEPIPFQEAVARYDRASHQDTLKTTEELRQEVIQRFPIEAWPNMPLERYALGLGNTQESFCWWMEFRTRLVGSMKGGSARKHLIYRQRDGSWFFDKQSYSNETEAWQALRAGFVEAFSKAKHGDWTGIDEIAALAGAAALRTKALHCYFPTNVLPITSSAHIRHFLKMLGSDMADLGADKVVQLNRALLDKMQQTPGFEDWQTQEIQLFLYWWADPKDRRRIVKIAPGENARFWEQCLKGGFICVGWTEVGDLREFDSKDSFQATFAEVFSQHYKDNKTTLTKKANELWTLRELEPGDLIVANQGINKILAVGTVVEPAYHYQSELEYGHLVSVKWDTSYEHDISSQKKWAFATVADVPQALSAHILSKQTGSGAISTEVVPVERLYTDIADALERKGQVILYGPPGTGKTYAARRFSVWWLMHQFGDESPDILTDPTTFDQAEQKLSTAQVVRRAWWMVANPRHWSWDRLFHDKKVEYEYGRLQRNYPLVRKGDLVVGYQATPDKRLVAIAQVTRELFTTADGQPAIEIEAVAKIDDGLAYEELQKDTILRDSEPMRFRCQGTLFALTESEFDHLAAILTEKNPDLRRHVEGAESVGPLTMLTFHASYSYEDFIEGYRPTDSKGGHLSLRLEDGIFKRVCREAQANPKKPYLVFIDEINRAHVPKVLGEMITLLEKDKRGLMVSLPQSKEPFTIPPNVYVLGTMNTADRSIKLLDAALRRRFAFVEVMPKPSLLQGGKVGTLLLDEFLEKLNRRIAEKEGREKQIGHSFLMEGDDPISDHDEFARRFRQEILPLLQEYCYDDYSVLVAYIGDELVDPKGHTLYEERLADPERLIEALEKAFSVESELA